MRLLILGCLLLLGCHNNKSVAPEPLYQEQWALHYDQAFYEAYEIDVDAHIHGDHVLNTYTGKGVKVAVIDIGLDKHHPEFKQNITHAINSADGSNDTSCSHSSDCYHGTAVTGIIAANANGLGLRGIAPDSQITFIKLDLAGYIGDDEILNALDYAERFDADIVSNSWGTEDVSPVVQEKIDAMATNGRNGKGIIFIFASGNDGKELTNDESMLDAVIGVGSSDEENLRAIYSNVGSGLDIVAPGGYQLGITTTYNSEDENHPSDFIRAEDHDKFQGTSASVPLVSGAIALLLEKNPQLTRQQIQQLLKDRSDKIGNIEYVDGHNKYYGYGKLNLGKLLE